MSAKQSTLQERIRSVLLCSYYNRAIQVIRNRWTPHDKKVIAYADIIVNITKGILAWVGGRVSVLARRLLKSKQC